MRMIIITTFYNAEKYIQKCILSLKVQTYKDFKCYLIDDMSTDNTVSYIKPLITNDDRFVLITNTEKKFKTKNFVDVLKNPTITDDEIVVELDGDDYLSNVNSLEKVSKIYKDKNVWITNGSFSYSNGQMGFSSPQINFDTLREDRFTASHLRTWKVFLWRNIYDDDHKDQNGDYLKINADLAYMLPMLEMSGSEHYRYIPDVLLIYNEQNPLNDHKVNMDLVNSCATYIRKKPKYEKL